MLKLFFSKKRFSFGGVLLSTLVAATAAYFLPVDPEQRKYTRFIYERSAQYHRPDRNPIIVIPGILGSRLTEQATGLKVWGAFNSTSVDPSTTEGAQLLALPIHNEQDCTTTPCLLKDQRDSVTSDGVLDEIRLDLFGLPVGIQAYANILMTLGAGGYRDQSIGLGSINYGSDHFTCFQFDYDWRRDNVENAKRLAGFITAKKAFVRKEYKKRFGIDRDDIKFDIIAHSMGGLISRYFLRYGGKDIDEIKDGKIPWTGSDDIERLIMVGTPNAGSPNSYVELVEGFDAGKPILPFYPSTILGTYPSIYQLLPRPRHKSITWDGNGGEVDLYDPKLWNKYGWGLASHSLENTRLLESILPNVASAEERRRIALAQQSLVLNRAKRFHELIDKPAPPPKGVELFLVAGDAVDTLSSIKLDPVTGAITKKNYSSGDGTVLRTSALMDERVGQDWEPQLKSPISWSSILFMAADHLGLTQDPSFENNVLYWLLEDQRTVLSQEEAENKDDKEEQIL